MPLALLLVLIIAMVFTSIYGWTVERLAYRPLRGSFRLAPLISAIGMSIFLQNYVQMAQGARVKPLPPMIPGGFVVMERGGGFIVSISYLPDPDHPADAGPDGRLHAADHAARRSAAPSAPASRTRPWPVCSASMSTGRSR